MYITIDGRIDHLKSAKLLELRLDSRTKSIARFFCEKQTLEVFRQMIVVRTKIVLFACLQNSKLRGGLMTMDGHHANNNNSTFVISRSKKPEI